MIESSAVWQQTAVTESRGTISNLEAGHGRKFKGTAKMFESFHMHGRHMALKHLKGKTCTRKGQYQIKRKKKNSAYHHLEATCSSEVLVDCPGPKQQLSLQWHS